MNSSLRSLVAVTVGVMTLSVTTIAQAEGAKSASIGSVASNAGGDFGTRPVTLGVGLRLWQLSLDYAYQGSEVLGSGHRLGLTFTAR